MLRGRTSRATVVACTRRTIAAVMVFLRASGHGVCESWLWWLS